MLKSLPATTVIAFGIGSGVSETELNNIASEPADEHVFNVLDPTNIDEQQLINAFCRGWSRQL